MWSRASLKLKLVSSFLGISLFILVVGGIGFWTLEKVARDYEEVSSFSLPNSNSLGDMRSSALGAIHAATLASITSANPDQHQDGLKQIDEMLTNYDNAKKAYLEVPFGPGEQALYEKENQAWESLRNTILKVKELASSKEPGAQDKAELMAATELDQSMDAFLSEIKALRQYQMKAAKGYVDTAHESARTGGLLSLVVVLAGCAISALIGLLFASALARRFNALAEQLLNGANEVASASHQISSASEQLSAAAAQQAASLQETSASVEEISAMVNKNTENAQQSQSASEVSREATESGRKAVDEMIQAVQGISHSNEEIGSRIQESNREFSAIVEVINEIGNKTKVINDIVFQTKLLSFNASVEAARAGEHGKGFAVVAEEVGNLAQMSGNAAKEISDMLGQSIQRVESIVQRTQNDLDRLMATGKEKVATGQSVAERCGQILEDVVSHVGEMSRMATEIASASTEQSQGIQEIGNAMRQLDQVTQQNASASHQAANASTNLTNQAETLRGLVGDLTSFVQGAGTERSFKSDVKKPGSFSRKPKKASRPNETDSTEPKSVKKDNVIPLKKKAAASEAAQPKADTFQLAAGSDIAAPLDSDPRFKDI